MAMPLQAALAAVYSLPQNGSRLIGHTQVHIAQEGDYFQALAERYNVGFHALLAANPNIDPFLIPEGSDITIPSSMLLPATKLRGIVINLAELRLYYFPENGNTVHVFPVGIGKIGFDTPIMTSYISEKLEQPTWRPTEATKKRYYDQYQITLPKEVPPGPDNPFGNHALRIGTTVYLIHGSNQRFGIGMRASSGCIRMYDRDIKWLYDHVPFDTPVSIINQPVKISQEPDKSTLIELHQPLTLKNTKQTEPALEVQITELILKQLGVKLPDRERLENFLKHQSGLVQDLTY